MNEVLKRRKGTMESSKETNRPGMCRDKAFCIASGDHLINHPRTLRSVHPLCPARFNSKNFLAKVQPTAIGAH